MVARHQLVSWIYLEGYEANDSERFVPGDSSLWKVIEDSLGALDFSISEGLLVDWGGANETIDDEHWNQLFSFPGICDASVTDTELAIAIQVRSRSPLTDDAVSLLLAYLAVHELTLPKLVQKVRIITISGAGASPEKVATLRGSLEKLVQFGAKSGLYDPLFQEARVVGPGSVQGWDFAGISEESEAIDFMDHVRSTKRHPLTTTYVVKETSSKLKGGDVVTTVSPIGILSSPIAGVQSFADDLDPLTLVLGLQARHSIRYSRVVHRELETITAFRERGVSLAYSTELYPFSSFLEIIDGFEETYVRNFEPNDKKAFLYISHPCDSRNSYEVRKLERFLAKISKLNTVQTQFLALEYGLCLGLARVAAKEDGMMFFESALKQTIRWSHLQTAFEKCLLVWISEQEKRELEKFAKIYGLSILLAGQSHEKSCLSLVGEAGNVRDIPMAELMGVLQVHAESKVLVDWSYENDRRPTYGFERANIFPDRFLMRSTQKNKLEMEVGNLLSSFFAGDLSRISLQRGAFSYPLGALRWSDGVQTYIDACGQARGLSKYNPRFMGIAVVDDAVRWLVSQGSMPHDSIGAVYVSMPSADLQSLAARQKAELSLAFDGLMIACKEYGIQVTKVHYSAHSGPAQQFELVFRVSKVIDPKSNFTIPGFRMEDEVLYAVGPKPPFVDSGSKILPYVRVVSNHVTELSLPVQNTLYVALVKCIEDSILSSMRPVSNGGIAEALGEMALWSGMGAKIKSSIPTIEVFSGAPGRFVVGVLPQFAKNFEALIPSELYTHLGASGGNKVLSLPLEELFESRKELANPREDVV